MLPMMFFAPDHVMTDYYDIRRALEDMVEAHANLITEERYNAPVMPADVNHRKYFWGTSECAIEATYYLNKTKKQLAEEKFADAKFEFAENLETQDEEYDNWRLIKVHHGEWLICDTDIYDMIDIPYINYEELRQDWVTIVTKALHGEKFTRRWEEW